MRKENFLFNYTLRKNISKRTLILSTVYPAFKTDEMVLSVKIWHIWL